MNVVNIHERRVPRPLAEVFDDLVALGTPRDRIWPDPTTPFRRSPGLMRVGVTTERHGPIRALLDDYQESTLIVWRGELPFLRGTHAFESHEAADGATLVRHVLRVRLAWWFIPVWVFYLRRVHNRIVEALLDRLAVQPVGALGYTATSEDTSK